MPCFRHFIIQKIINYYFSFVSFRIKKPFLIPVPPGYFYVLLVLLESFYISKLPLPPGYHCVERGCIAESKDYITHEFFLVLLTLTTFTSRVPIPYVERGCIVESKDYITHEFFLVLLTLTIFTSRVPLCGERLCS